MYTQTQPASNPRAARLDSSKNNSTTEEQPDYHECPARTPWLVGTHDSGRAILFKTRCKRWSCPVCGPLNAWAASFRASAGAHALYDAGEPVQFATITAHGALTAHQAYWVAPKAWKTLHTRLQRQIQPRALRYFAVPETDQNGRIHLHAIWNAGVSERWLKDNAAEVGFGFMDDVQDVHDSGGVVGYVVKYLRKNAAMDLPRYTHRFRTSRGWPRVPGYASDWTFERIPTLEGLNDVWDRLESLGYDVRLLGGRAAWAYVREVTNADLT